MNPRPHIEQSIRYAVFFSPWTNANNSASLFVEVDMKIVMIADDAIWSDEEDPLDLIRPWLSFVLAKDHGREVRHKKIVGRSRHQLVDDMACSEEYFEKRFEPLKPELLNAKYPTLVILTRADSKQLLHKWDKDDIPRNYYLPHERIRLLEKQIRGWWNTHHELFVRKRTLTIHSAVVFLVEDGHGVHQLVPIERYEEVMQIVLPPEPLEDKHGR